MGWLWVGSPGPTDTEICKIEIKAMAGVLMRERSHVALCKEIVHKKRHNKKRPRNKSIYKSRRLIRHDRSLLSPRPFDYLHLYNNICSAVPSKMREGPTHEIVSRCTWVGQERRLLFLSPMASAAALLIADSYYRPPLHSVRFHSVCVMQPRERTINTSTSVTRRVNSNERILRAAV